MSCSNGKGVDFNGNFTFAFYRCGEEGCGRKAREPAERGQERGSRLISRGPSRRKSRRRGSSKGLYTIEMKSRPIHFGGKQANADQRKRCHTRKKTMWEECDQSDQRRKVKSSFPIREVRVGNVVMEIEPRGWKRGVH